MHGADDHEIARGADAGREIRVGARAPGGTALLDAIDVAGCR